MCIRDSQITEYQVDSAFPKPFDRFFSGCAGDHAVAASFEKDFSDGKGLFVVVDAENGSLRFHGSPHARSSSDIACYQNIVEVYRSEEFRATEILRGKSTQVK